MCFNKETSIIAYILTTILSILLFIGGNKYDKNIAIFSLVFIQIQLAEYFMWLDQDCGEINNYATIYAHIILMLQPLSLMIGAYIYDTLTLPKICVITSIIILLIPTILVIRMNIMKKRKLCSKESRSGYLEWDFINGNTETWPIYYPIIYMTYMFIPWLFFKNKFTGLLAFGLMTGSFILGKINTSNIYLKFKQWESKWCILAIIFPLIYLVLTFLRK